VSHKLVESRSPTLVETHLLVLLSSCLITMDGGCRVACAIALLFKRYDRREKRFREATHPANAPLEHVPTKLHDFVDKDMLQHMDLARFLFGEVIPLRREAR
jgi:hypothetical protein